MQLLISTWGPGLQYHKEMELGKCFLYGTKTADKKRVLKAHYKKRDFAKEKKSYPWQKKKEK